MLRLAGLVVALSTLATGQNVSGVWITNGGPSSLSTFQLHQDGNSVSGRVNIAAASLGFGCSQSLTGSVLGQSIVLNMFSGYQSTGIMQGQVGADSNSIQWSSFTSTAVSIYQCGGGTTGASHGFTSARADGMIVPFGMVSATDYSFDDLAGGGYASIFGIGLADGTYSAAIPYPTKLGSTAVYSCPGNTFDQSKCTPASMVLASPTQLNFLLNGTFGISPRSPSTARMVVVVNGKTLFSPSFR